MVCQSTHEMLLSNASLSDFKLWNHTTLPKFLSVRGKPVTGTDDELAARYYC